MGWPVMGCMDVPTSLFADIVSNPGARVEEVTGEGAASEFRFAPFVYVAKVGGDPD